MTFGVDNTTFLVDVIGDRTGKQWVGEFTVKTLLSHRDDMVRDIKRREFLGPDALSADAYTANTADIFSDLFVRVVKAPAFWTESNGGLDLVDTNVVREVYTKAVAREREMNARMVAEAEKAKAELLKKQEADKALAG